MKCHYRTITDQGEKLRNLVLKHGLNSKRLDVQFRIFCMHWLALGIPANEFDKDEYENLRKNYEWVCARLAELTQK